MMLLRTNRSSSAKVAAGSFGERAQIADLLVGERHHLLEPLLVASGERAQPAAEVVVQHQRPAAEQLLGQELGEHAVARIRSVADPRQSRTVLPCSTNAAVVPEK